MNKIEPNAARNVLTEYIDIFLDPFGKDLEILLLDACLSKIKGWIASTKSKLTKGYKSDSVLNEDCKAALQGIIQSNVFKEAFNKTTYFPALTETDFTKLGKNIDKHIMFAQLPDSISGITSYFQQIFINNRFFYHKETNLVNAAIVAIMIHELAHFFLRYQPGQSYQKIKTPNKQILNRIVKEGGECFEEIIFGHKLSFMNAERAEFILELSNWNRKLDDFRADFKSIVIDEIGSSISLFKKGSRCIYEIFRKVE